MTSKHIAKQRNPAIELYRILCMFGVCLLHALDQGGFADGHRGLDNLMWPSVVGFIFISGYFGIRFKWRSAAKLLFNGLYCFAIMSVIGVWVEGGGWATFFRIFQGSMGYGWFLWMCLALMMVAPCFEPLFADPSAGAKSDLAVLRKVLPVFFLVCIWSYAATKIPCMKIYLPKVVGFDGFGLLTFIGVYLFARTCRHYAVEQFLSPKQLLLVALISGTACWFNFMHYHSPFAFAFAASIFYLVKKLDGILSSRFFAFSSSFLLLIAPSMFSVYLFHNNPVGLKWLVQFEAWAIVGHGWNYYLTALIIALAAMLFGTVADVPRRMFVR